MKIQSCKDSHHILNSKSEYNRCALPRLSLQLGDKQFKDKLKEDEEDRKKEEDFERKIRDMRKEQNKIRGGKSLKYQPKPKKMK